MTNLESEEVSSEEVVGGAATPVHDVLVLASAAQPAVPVGDPQVGLHKRGAEFAVANHSVEEGLRRRRGRERERS